MAGAQHIAAQQESTQPTLGVDHRAHAEPLARHLLEGRAQRGAQGDARQALATVHHLIDVQQETPPQASGGMGPREIIGGEAACLQQGDRERVAHR